MCGIAGIIDSNSQAKRFDNVLLKRMSDVIIHRGPDSEGQWISRNNQAGFSFRRLAIIDLSENGNQPMTSRDGRYTIVFNGEIYNHQEIRQELISKGYNYRSGTDTETILNAYAEWGEAFITRLTGMWAIAIWDEEKSELFLSRDRIGIKPLYYYHKNGLLIFGSEIKSILQHDEVNKEMSLENLPLYLNFGMTGNRETLFANINKIPAAHYIKYSNGELQLKRYWSPFESAKQGYPKMNDNEIQSEVLRLLRQSVKDRMMSDVPFGVFLSGGVDSSVNVALMDELMDRPVDTFTVGFKELEQYNELEYARKIVGIFKTNHHEVLIDHNDAFDILGNLAWHEDEPNADPVCIPLYYVSKLTRDSGTTVIQVGEGSDEQFVGYKWMLREWNFYNNYWQKYKKLPSILQKIAYIIMKIPLAATDRYLHLEYLRRGTFGNELYWGGIPIIAISHMKNMFEDFDMELIYNAAEYGDNLHRESSNQYPKADYLQKMIYNELTNRIAEMLLMRVDKIGMAHSIEARVPFLDHRLVEFTMSLSPEQRLPDGKLTKYILKKSVEELLPNEIIYRKKMGFAAPISEWLKTHWYKFAEETLLNSYFTKNHILNRLFLKEILNRHKSGKADYSQQIFSLIMLNLWHDKFIK